MNGVALALAAVYWTGGPTGTIGRANLNGSNAETSFITGASYPIGVAVDADHVYWGNFPSTIGRANLDGTSPNQSFITGANDPFGVAVDALAPLSPPDTDPPETTITKGAPNKLDKHRFKFKFGSDEPGSTFECKLDKKPFKPCSSPKKVKRLDDGKHKFKVRAVDAAGNVGPSAAKDKFKVVD